LGGGSGRHGVKAAKGVRRYATREQCRITARGRAHLGPHQGGPRGRQAPRREARGRSRGSPDGQAARSRAGCPDGPLAKTGSRPCTNHRRAPCGRMWVAAGHCSGPRSARHPRSKGGQVERHTGDAAVGRQPQALSAEAPAADPHSAASRLATAFRQRV
jgi:hypothetical protein